MKNNIKIPIISATSFKSRLLGLMGKTNINYGLFFPHCNGIHTFFMKVKIDVIGLNENNKIIFLERNVKPNKIIKINRNIKKTSILELPNNTSNNLKIGNTLFFEFKDII